MFENERLINVYVKIDYNYNVTEIGSDVFIKDTNGWIWIDSGYGDKYAHAQTQYLAKRIINNDGTYNYKYNGGRVVEL